MTFGSCAIVPCRRRTQGKLARAFTLVIFQRILHNLPIHTPSIRLERPDENLITEVNARQNLVGENIDLIPCT